MKKKGKVLTSKLLEFLLVGRQERKFYCQYKLISPRNCGRKFAVESVLEEWALREWRTVIDLIHMRHIHGDPYTKERPLRERNKCFKDVVFCRRFLHYSASRDEFFTAIIFLLFL